MTTTVTIRLPSRLARALKAKARAAKTSPTAVLRKAAAEYVRDSKDLGERSEFLQHIDAYAGTWDGYCSGVELLRKTRP